MSAARPLAGASQMSVHQLVLDLRPHQAHRYWSDFLMSALVFWFCITGVQFSGWPWPTLGALLAVGSLALYRSALFVHEIGHFSKRTLPGFELAWNVLIGWPLLFPSFLIQSHPDHHRQASFGTVQDPEYLPFASAPKSAGAWFVLSATFVPLMLWLRAAMIVPLSWFAPKLRQWLRVRGSRMVMNNAYQPTPQTLRLSKLHELSEWASVLCAWGWVALWWAQVFSTVVVLFALACMALANVLNAWRTLNAHAYTSVGQATDLLGQMRDSTTFSMPVWVGELIAPVGQRFHAAHHLFPYLPYHALPKAHARLLVSHWHGLDGYKNTQR